MRDTQQSEAAADDTPLLHLFDDSARARLLSVFVDERKDDLTVTELADQAGVARSTVYDHLDDLLDLDVIEETRETGGSTRYQLDDDSEIAAELYKLTGSSCSSCSTTATTFSYVRL